MIKRRLEFSPHKQNTTRDEALTELTAEFRGDLKYKQPATATFITSVDCGTRCMP